MKTVTSKDGTTIAFDQPGQGPAVILVDEALHRVSHPWDSVSSSNRLNFIFDNHGKE